MKRMYDEPLRNHTTFKIGGPVDVLSIPESEEELINEIKRCQNEGIDYRILGNGSNLLVDHRGLDEVVIKNTEACTKIEKESNVVKIRSLVFYKNLLNFLKNLRPNFLTNNLK